MQKKERIEQDLIVIRPQDEKSIDGAVKILFDGYTLYWKETSRNKEYTAFSGQADESAKESAQNLGPTPQGKYAIDPGRIEDKRNSDGSENEDWGSNRVALEPYRETVDRMKDCFGLIRVEMYIHGGSSLGTIGCIELNNNEEEADFFSRLKAFGKKIEVEVKYAGEREKKYEESSCPYISRTT